MSYILLGIDIGTSSCKIAAFTPDGDVVAQSTQSYSVAYPRSGWAEQDPDEWWSSVCRGIRAVLAQGIAAQDICAIGIDGQSWSAIAVDAGGRVLCPTPIWMDTRAASICRDVNARFPDLFQVCGNPFQPSYTMPKVLWYRENAPEVYRSADKILQSNGFIAYRLTGQITHDLSQGYGWACFDMTRLCWDRELCRSMGVRPELLPELAACHQIIGSVTPEAAALTGLSQGTPVVAGGLDAACGTLGVGVIAPGQTQEQGGQAGGMSICMDHAYADERLILSPHVVPGRWLLQGGTVGGSGCLRWFEQEFGAAERAFAAQQGGSSFAQLSAEAETVPPGCDGLIFLPYLSGERSPIWDPDATGVFFHVDFSKTRAHFARAVMEGVAYSLRHNLEIASAAGAQVGDMYAMGGAVNSLVWTQLKADITGKRILVPSADTATALGAAILAGIGAGVYTSFDEAVAKTVRIRREHIPNPENSTVYDARYRTYRALYPSLKPFMKED